MSSSRYERQQRFCFYHLSSCGGDAAALHTRNIGVADFETLSLVTAALAGKRFRAQLGGEWAVASFIVARMVHAPKCRAADDLLLSAEHHPSLKAARQLLPDLKG